MMTKMAKKKVFALWRIEPKTGELDQLDLGARQQIKLIQLVEVWLWYGEDQTEGKMTCKNSKQAFWASQKRSPNRRKNGRKNGGQKLSIGNL
jgi:hypothetical protein